MSNFVHLHVHSEHSGLDSTARVRDLVRTAARMGQPAVAITDHGTLAGIYDAIDEGKKQGVKVIAGLEAYLAIGSRHEQNFIEVPGDDFDTDAGDEREGRMKRKRYHHITVLAKSPTGWRNLVAMHNASADSMWGKHRRIDYDLLKEHSEDLIVLTGCLGGPVLGPMASGDEEGARKGLEALIDAVGHSNVYVEIMEHGIPQETKALRGMAKLAREYDLPLVATNDSHYIEPDGARAHEAWLAMQTGKKLTDPAKDRFTFTGEGYHFRTAEEMRRLREEKWWTHACNNTLKLAERIEDDVLPETYLRLPSFPIPEGFESSRKYLAHLIREGAKQRWGDPYPKEVAERLKAEMRVIAGFGVVDYFLIVHDVITWARSQGIRVGPGRGSAAGSAISFALGIVQVDPLRYDLLFERFLDPTRVGMPDIDIDFEKGRRDEVFAYLADKYGWDHVARIGTFQMSKTKAAIKSAARVLGYPVSLGDKISKAVPMAGAEPYTFSRIDETCETDSSGFWETVEDDDRGEETIDLARRFENVVTGASIHACGVVIADESLTDLVPLRRDTRGEEGDPLITEWDADGIEGSGLLKLDVLGLRNLDIVSAATRNAHAIDSGTDVDPDHLPDTDDLDNDQVRNAWRLLAAGHTAGVFQLESQGMTELAQDVQPTSLEHLSALVALYRPGPLSAGLNDAYAARKNGREEISYDAFTSDPQEQEIIASVLGSTYGVCVADGEQVYSVTRGHPVPIQDIQVGEVVQGVNDQTFTDSAGKVLSVINSGIKEVVEARFSAGFTLRATPDHRVLTPHGWTAIQDLSEGDLVATPTSVIADAPDIGGMDEHQARVLGSLLADGGISYRTNVTLYATTPEITRAFHEAVALGFPDCHTSKHVRPTGVVMTSVTNGGGNGGKASSLVEWLRELGLKSSTNTEGGVTSEDKFIPDEWLAAPDHLAAVLLAAMWDCDGHISNGNQGIRYKTISARLAAGIRFLLLRLGILTNISEATYGDRTAFDIQVVSREKFVDMVAPHMVHPGKSRSARENGFEDANTNLFYRDDVRAAVTESYRGFSARTGIPSGSLGRAYRYSKGASAARVAQETGDEHLNHLLNSRWVKFQGYKPTGVSQVWDLEVEGIHSFTASGVIVHNCAYQEQMMQIGDVVAGFGPSERNRLRKAVSRKDQAEIDAVGELFMQGATSSTGIRGNEKLAFRESTARELWRTIQGAGEYAFNRSHSAAYGQLAYVTAYLKANWPAAFGAAILGETKDEDKRRYALASLAEEGVEVLPPNVNTSGFSSTPVNMTSVVLGLGEIKDVGKAAAPIVSEREENGPFTSAGNILDRVRIPGKDGTQSRLTVRVVEALIEAGACDDFGPRKGQLRVLRALRERPGTPIPDEEWGLVERAVRQHSRLGLIVGTHPIRAIQDQVKAFDWPVVKDEWRRDLVRKPLPVHRILTTKLTAVSTIGLVTRWKVMPDNRGGQRADVQIEGTHGRIQAVVWNDTIRTMRSEGRDIDVGSVVAVTARVRIREIEQEDDEGNTSTTEVRSLTITNIWPIDYLDVDGSVPAVDLGIDLNARCFSPGLVGRVEPAPKPPVPDADSEDLEELIEPKRARVEDLLDGDEPSDIEPQTVKEYWPYYFRARPSQSLAQMIVVLFPKDRDSAEVGRAVADVRRISRVTPRVYRNTEAGCLMLVRLSGDSFGPILIPVSEQGKDISSKTVDRVLASEGVWRVAKRASRGVCEVFEPVDPSVLRIDEKSLVSK